MTIRGDALAQLRAERDALAVHRLGPRVMLELLAEIARDNGIEDGVRERLAAYAARLTPEMLAVTGGDRLVPRPLRLVPRP